MLLAAERDGSRTLVARNSFTESRICAIRGVNLRRGI
jgi:hypothetical protein